MLLTSTVPAAGPASAGVAATAPLGDIFEIARSGEELEIQRGIQAHGAIGASGAELQAVLSAGGSRH